MSRPAPEGTAWDGGLRGERVTDAPSSSALTSPGGERVLPEMAKFGGTVIRTNLTAAQQQALEEALSPSAA